MDKLLKNIENIRDEINNITERNKEKTYEYCEISIKIIDTEEEIDRLSSMKNDLEDSILSFKLKRGILFTSPFGIILSFIYFISLIVTNLDNLTLWVVLFTIIGIPALGISIPFMLSSFLINSKKFSNFLKKKYPHLQKMDNQLNNLIIRQKVTEKGIINMKNRKEEIINTITDSEEILDGKKEYLHNLEEEYFSINSNIHIINGANPSKKRTKTLKK